MLLRVLYLFDGYNILHAGTFSDRRALVDALASYVALRGARGVVVFDGAGDDAVHGPLQVRFASPADTLIERLAAEHRGREEVWVVSSDRDLRGTAGQETRKVGSKEFVRELSEPARPAPPARSSVEDALDPETRQRLERFRRRRH